MKNKPYKRFLAFLLCAAMMITYMPSAAFTFADEGSDDQQTVEEAKPAAPAAEKKVEKKEEKKEEAKAEKAPAPAAEEKVETPAPEPKAEEPAETPKEEPAEKPEASGDETRAGPEETEPVKEQTDEPAEEAAGAAVEETTDEAIEETAEEVLEETGEEAVDEEALVEEDVEEDEDADKEDDEVELNKEVKTFTGSSGEVDVHVVAQPDTFPVGTKMVVKSVSSESVQGVAEGLLGEEVTSIKAVDISFEFKGKEIEPLKSVSVTMNAHGMPAGADKSVIHISDSGNAQIVASATDDGVSSFTSGDFSVYLMASSDGIADKDAADPKAEGDEPEKIKVTFDPTTDPAEPLAHQTIEVTKGEKIGDQLPDVPEVPGYNTKWVNGGEEVTAETEVTEPFTATVGKDKIVYTVTFVQEDGTEETRETSIDDGFAVNDLPAVAPKTNKVGKWVYPGTTNEFTVGTVISKDLTVNAYYEQNIFTVTFMVDGVQYEQMTTATGTKIVLPSDPIKAGTTFSGWFTEPDGEGTQYTASSTVNQDLTLYAYFADQVRVSFLVKDDDGNVISDKSQYFVDLSVGDTITTLPDDPFIEGKTFDRWEHETTHAVVEVGTKVTESFNAVAVFKQIETYELTVNYFYMNGNNRVEVGTQVYDLVETDFSGDSATYTVTAPGYTIATEVTDEPTYYPSQPTITVSKDQFTKTAGKYTLTVEDEFVAADASYKVGHYLKSLSGEGYALIETVDKVGVKNTKATPDVKNYDYADYERRDENVTITGEADQELKVYYTRRDFTLSYNVGEGDYIDAVTAPYGTEVTLPTTATRAGYTFAGWYKDDDCTQSAGTSITLEDNTTVYAKWNAAQVDYKIVYMIENANDTDYSYLATVTKQAATGSTITMTAQSAGAQGTRPSDLDTTNFTFKDSTTEVVDADGTTVVTVRYSRNVYTLQGRYNNGNVNNARVTAKYGADIHTLWANTFGAGNNAQYSWSYNNENNSKFKSLSVMPSLSVRTNNSPANTIYVYRHSDNADYYQHLEYWLQNYTGPGIQTTTHDGKTYGLVKSIDMRYNYLSNVDDWYEISGYTKAGYTATASETQNGTYSSFTYTWGNWFNTYTHTTGPWYYQTTHYDAKYTRFNFYYDAEKYPLTFYNYDGTLISTQDVTLGNDISNYLTSNVPNEPMDGATWKGWYTDQAHTSAYSGGTKMPAGLVLYGDFEFPTRTISYNSQGGSDVASETDEYGFYATRPADPTKEHFTFLGWFTAADETGSPYDWNKPVTEDTTMYAHWKQNTIGYTVHYYEKGTTTKVLDDKVVSDPNFTEGKSITENAATVAGHVADAATKTIELSFDETKNVITFYYAVIPNELTYTVNYVLKDHPEIKVAESKTVTVPGTTTNAMEMAVAVDQDYFETQTEDAEILGKHYKPTETSKELQLALENNVITFEYVPFTTTKITVNYLDMDGNSIHDTDTSYVEKGDTFTVQNKAPDGYVYHHAYLDGTTTAPQATYQITGKEGDLVINIYYQKKLIIIANNKSKTYDGTALFSSFDNTSDWTVTGTLRGDELTSVAFDGSQTDAGTSATTPENAQITKGDQAITDPETYYDIIYVPGSLTVKPVSVYISISADQWNTHSGGSGPNYYTGQIFNVGFTNPNKQHFNDKEGSAYVSITSGQRALFKGKYGDAIWNALYGENGALISEKDAGTYTVTGAQQRAKVAAVTVGGQNIMSDPNYSITLNARDSFLKIDPLPLTIKTPDAEKTYDGDPLTKSEGATLDHSYWTANIGGTWTDAETAGPGSVTLGTGETITFNVTGSQTPIGSSDNIYSIGWGENKSSNYKITAELGTLTVKATDLIVTIKNASTDYSGEEQEGYSLPDYVIGNGSQIDNENYTITGLVADDKLTIKYTPAKGTAVGSDYKGSFAETYTITNANGDDVTANYETKTFTPGKLTINKASLTITAKPQTYTYNGKAQGEDKKTYTEGFDSKVTVEGLKGSDALTSITLNGQETNVGEYADKIVPSAAVVGTATGNYNINYVAGKLTINKATLTITAKPQTYTYNGEEQGEDNKTYTEGFDSKVTVEGLKGSDALTSITLNGQETNVGEYVDKIVPSAAAVGGSTGNYEITYVPGTLTITQEEPPTPPTPPTSHMTIEKVTTSTPANGETYALGETITYKITATNDGEATLTNVTVVDELTGDTWPIASLAVGASEEFTAQYVVKEADILAGKVVNNATAEGNVTPGTTEDPTEDPNPSITVNKTASPSKNAKEGTVINYTVTVRNTGNVTVSNITIDDSLVNVTEDPFTLAPGETKRITYKYTVTAADVENGSVSNIATATGTDPNGGDTPGTDTVVVTTEEDDDDDDDDDTPTPTPPAPAGPAGPAPAGPGVVPAAPADGTPIADDAVPQAEPEAEPETDIPDEATPLAAGTWAVLNLVAAILTTLGAVVALFRKKEDDDEDEDEQNKPKTDEEDEDDNRGKKMLAAKIAGAVAGVAAPITFFLTEDMTQNMALTDKWTLLMVVFLAAQVVTAVLNKKASELDDEKEEEAEAAN